MITNVDTGPSGGPDGAPGPRPEGTSVIAIDVGGTGIKAALLDGTGTVRHTERHRTGAQRGPEPVVATILDVAAGLAATAGASGTPARAAGIVVPGVVDEVAGVARWSANVGFRDVPLRHLLAQRLGLPAVLGHDVRAGGLAEARLGAGRGHGQVLFVAVGTGIAAAHVVHGRVLAGAHHAAGELGHIVVRPGGARCNCGARGCLETVASATAVARGFAERTGGTATAAEVVRLALSGDRAAERVWADALDALATALHTAVTLYDPDVVIIGGGLAEAGEALFGSLSTALDRRLTFQTRPKLLRAALADWAGCLGAGLLALDLPAAAGAAGTAGTPDVAGTAGR